MYKQVEVANILPLLIILACGFAASLIAFLFEIIVKRVNEKKDALRQRKFIRAINYNLQPRIAVESQENIYKLYLSVYCNQNVKKEK